MMLIMSKISRQISKLRPSLESSLCSLVPTDACPYRLFPTGTFTRSSADADKPARCV